MNNFTANTYEMKREIMNFCKKISRCFLKYEVHNCCAIKFRN